MLRIEAKAKAKAFRGRPAGKAGGKGKALSANMFAAPSCPLVVTDKKRFCDDHNCTWDNMVYQARTTKLYDEEGNVKLGADKEPMTRLAEFNKQNMRDDRVAGAAVEKQSIDQPSDKMYRRHAFIDWEGI